MYRLVVVLTILSLSGSEATGPKRERSASPEDAHKEETSSGVLKAARLELHSDSTRSARGESSGASEPKTSTFAGNAQTQETGSQILEETSLDLHDKFMFNGRVYLDSLVGADLVRNLRRSRDRDSRLRYGLLLEFSELRFIKKDVMNDKILCAQEDLDTLIKFEKQMEKAFAKRTFQIDTGLDSFMVMEFSWMAKNYLTHCMPKLKERIDKESNNPNFQEAFERMRVFEILIDEEKAAQRNGYPRYCNDEIQVFNSEKYKNLVSEIGNTVGKELLINEDNINSINSQPKETKEVMRDYLGKTCRNMLTWMLGVDMEFIMSAKRLFKFNREWNLKFDCGEKVGLLQLCRAATEKFFEL